MHNCRGTQSLINISTWISHSIAPVITHGDSFDMHLAKWSSLPGKSHQLLSHYALSNGGATTANFSVTLVQRARSGRNRGAMTIKSS